MAVGSWQLGSVARRRQSGIGRPLTPTLSPKGAREKQSGKFSFAAFADFARHFPEKSFLNEIFGLRGGAVGADAVFDGDDAGLVPAERGVNGPRLRRHMAVDDGEVFFPHGAGFPDFGQLARGNRIFGDEDEAGGFAVETMDQVGRRERRERSF